jgi:DNA-binding response OmpR family regulator
MSETRYRLLLVEDDPNLGSLLSDYLTGEGFEVKRCMNGFEAQEWMKENRFHLMLLDVMMPKKDGFALAAEFRARDKETPVIFITAKSMKEDKMKGYDLGADDYITKPFDEEELLFKIRAMLRRSGVIPVNDASPVVMGKFLFDFRNQSIFLNGKAKRITERESEILNYLYEHRNVVIRREVMLKELWGENDYFIGRSLDVFLSKIRRYLKDDPELFIENVFGVGFIFNVPEGTK